MFHYYVEIPVTYSSDGAQTNYQMKLTIVKGTGSNSAGTIYLNNHAANWPYDIQFKNVDGDVLDYWREEYDATDMTVWVECDSIAASGNTTFYLYYGDSGASDASDGDDTFIIFDHFDGTTIDTDKWSGTSAAQAVSDSYVTCSPPETQTWNKIYSTTNAPASRATRAYGKLTYKTASIGCEPNPCCNSREIVYNTGLLSTNNSGTTTQTNGLYSYDTFYTWEIRKIAGASVKLYLNNSYVGQITTNVGSLETPECLAAGRDMAGPGYTILDWILVRKLTLNEPVWASPGEEAAVTYPEGLLFFPRKYRGPDDLSFLELS